MEPQVIAGLMLGGSLLIGVVIGFFIGKPGKKAKEKIALEYMKEHEVKPEQPVERPPVHQLPEIELKPIVEEKKYTQEIEDNSEYVELKPEIETKLEFAGERKKREAINPATLQTFEPEKEGYAVEE